MDSDTPDTKRVKRVKRKTISIPRLVKVIQQYARDLELEDGVTLHAFIDELKDEWFREAADR